MNNEITEAYLSGFMKAAGDHGITEKQAEGFLTPEFLQMLQQRTQQLQHSQGPPTQGPDVAGADWSLPYVQERVKPLPTSMGAPENRYALNEALLGNAGSYDTQANALPQASQRSGRNPQGMNAASNLLMNTYHAANAGPGGTPSLTAPRPGVSQPHPLMLRARQALDSAQQQIPPEWKQRLGGLGNTLKGFMGK